MEHIFLHPVTPVYFGRPGALPAGEARSGISWFPPPISAFQGMVRTRLLDDAGVFSPPGRVAELVGKPDELPPGWHMQGPFPAYLPAGEETMQTWLPAPAFALKPKAWEQSKPPVLARRLEAGQALCDAQGQAFEPLGNPGAGAEKPVGGWLSSRNLWHLLKGDPEQWDGHEYGPHLPPFVGQEIKIGLAREKKEPEAKETAVGSNLHLSGRPQEGMLYSLGTLRFAEHGGLVGWFAGDLAPPLRPSALARGRVVAGKKGGIMAFAPLPGKEDPHWADIAAGKHLGQGDLQKDDALFWVILLSSGRWRHGPAGAGDHGLATAAEMLARAADLPRVDLLGMLCPAVTWLGGFSLAECRPRPAEPWFAPGTCLLVRVRAVEGKDHLKAIQRGWNNRCVLAPEKKLSFGYGHILAAHYHEQ